jgi:DNA-binding FadR family transcriptional regulator
MHVQGEMQRVADEILARIIGGTYPSGLRLPSEVDLAVEFDCGRSTIREALRHLAGLGVVRSRRGSGAMVLDFRREGTPPLLPPYVLAGRFDRPPLTLARELLRLRALLAGEAVRLAALYAEPGALAEARRILAGAAAVERDPAAHAVRELELFRALVCASGIWPAVWLSNAFWAPMRELQATLAPAVGPPPADFQPAMARLLDLIEARDADGAERHISAWLARVDAGLLDAMGVALGAGSVREASAKGAMS